MSIRCGNTKVHGNAKDVGPQHHETVAQVRLCFTREGGLESLEDAGQREDCENEYDADAAYERHLENAGHEEAMLQDRMEAEAGVIPFDEAMRNAERDAEAQSVTKSIADVLSQFPEGTPAGDAGRARKPLETEENLMTTVYIAWATTSQTMPESDPGISITKTEVDDDGYRDERGVVQTSEIQDEYWGISPVESTYLYEPEANTLLATMGWERTNDWTRASLSFAAAVVKKET